MPQIISNGIKYTNGNPFSGKYEDLEGKPTVFGPSGPKAKEGFVPSPSTTAGTTKYLREDGTWAVPPDTDTTYSDMKGATASAAGEHGLAPAPSAGAQNKYLTGGATYQNVDDHAATFTSTDIDDGSANAWTNVAKLTSGEKHSSIFNKLSTMFKNVRYLYRMLGTTDISGIGDGTVTGAIRELNTGKADFVIARSTFPELTEHIYFYRIGNILFISSYRQGFVNGIDIGQHIFDIPQDVLTALFGSKRPKSYLMAVQSFQDNKIAFWIYENDISKLYCHVYTPLSAGENVSALGAGSSVCLNLYG